MQHGGSARVGCQLASLAALIVGEEHDITRVGDQMLE
jgi:hypothetical protein